ncbi:MAG: 2-amino-5-chloromuconate deaminase CnbZ [Pseudorhodoplanes sp.]
MSTIDFAPGGYRFIKGPFQYSAGVAALQGFRLVRVMFRNPVPLDEGFSRIETIIKAAGRPLTAFAACELRSPAPFTEAGFKAFNETYVGTLSRWGIFDGSTNPVARSNVCPELHKPASPSFHAFTYTEPGDAPIKSVVVAGSGEAEEGHATYREKVIRLGDVSPDGLRDKARWVLGEMERRLGLLGASWADTTAAQVYTVHDLHPFLGGEIVKRGAARCGLTWHYCRPPVVDLEYEMDCRSVSEERVV